VLPELALVIRHTPEDRKITGVIYSLWEARKILFYKNTNGMRVECAVRRITERGLNNDNFYSRNLFL
jgi:hypothetical protein